MEVEVVVEVEVVGPCAVQQYSPCHGVQGAAAPPAVRPRPAGRGEPEYRVLGRLYWGVLGTY